MLPVEQSLSLLACPRTASDRPEDYRRTPTPRGRQRVNSAAGRPRRPSDRTGLPLCSTGSTKSLTRRLKFVLVHSLPQHGLMHQPQLVQGEALLPQEPVRVGLHSDEAAEHGIPISQGGHRLLHYQGVVEEQYRRPGQRAVRQHPHPPAPQRHRTRPATPSAPPTSPTCASRAQGRRRSAAGAAPRPATARGRPSDARPLPLSARSSAGCARTCRAEPARPAHVVAERASAARALLRHRRPTARPDSPHEDHGMTPTAGRRVMLDRRDSDGTMSREVSLAADGRLNISGQASDPGSKGTSEPRSTSATDPHQVAGDGDLRAGLGAIVRT